MIENGLKAIGREPDPAVRETFTKYRKTHMRPYSTCTREIRPAGVQHHHRPAGRLRRGRIIGDYRRVALYGVDRLIKAKKAERAEIDARWPTRSHAAARGNGDQLRALADLKTMAARTTATSASRHRMPAKRAVDLLRLLGAIKEMNGAAMSVGRISTSSTSTSSAILPKKR